MRSTNFLFMIRSKHYLSNIFKEETLFELTMRLFNVNINVLSLNWSIIFYQMK